MAHGNEAFGQGRHDDGGDICCSHIDRVAFARPHRLSDRRGAHVGIRRRVRGHGQVFATFRLVASTKAPTKPSPKKPAQTPTKRP